MRNSDEEKLAAPDYKRLFEEAPGLYMVLDPQLRVVAASNAYLQATLTSRDDIIGRHVFDIFPDNPDDPSADSVRNSRASFNRVLQTRTPDTIGLQRHDVRRPESEGGGFEERYWSAINYPILNPDGSLAYIVHRVENVTEFVKLKQRGVEQSQLTDALREQAVKMEADLYSRSREMAETSQRLKEANEELARLCEKTKELDALKTDFFANVSHELRTPLTLVLGPVRKLLASADLSPESRRHLAMVQRNARLLLKNVNDLLDLSKLDAGGMQPEYARVDLVHLTRFVAAHFETVADDLKIRFALDTPAALPAEVDPAKMQRVLFNLLSNAFKFTPAGGTVRFILGEEEGKAVFAVEDTGPGIPPAMRETIFERFRQVESGSTRKHGGTGLGLSIAKEFVALHRGTIEVTEAAEGGARFMARIPLSAPEGTAVRTAAPGAEEEGESPTVAELLSPKATPVREVEPLPPGAPLVLVVEDNPEMNAFVAEVLRRDHRVVSAFDGVEGLEQALRLLPDLVITDVMMPRMAGDEMIRHIRQHRELDDVPILLLTAKADEELRVRLLRSGAQDSLPKPFLAEELVARASGLIARKRKAEESLRAVEELRSREQMLMQQSRLAAMGEMVINISHQWRQPLNILAASVQRLGIMYEHGGFTKELLDQTTEDVMEVIRKMSQTIDDFQNFLSPRKEKTSFSVDDVIRRTVALVEENFKSQGIRIDITSSGGEAYGVANEFGHVLMNLLTNAKDALTQHRDTDRQIRIRSWTENEKTMVTVTDNAGGIEEAVADKIFDAYFTTKELGKGTGVGLFLSKIIIEKNMGGRLSFRNVEGGAEFEIRI